MAVSGVAQRSTRPGCAANVLSCHQGTVALLDEMYEYQTRTFAKDKAAKDVGGLPRFLLAWLVVRALFDTLLHASPLCVALCRRCFCPSKQQC
jgi:hypothetical protein